MKHRGKNMAPLLAGILVGMALAGPVANAATEYFEAQRTPHPIYVDGQQVQMETYAINGHNYVKLQDIGKQVGFEVYWDGSAAQIVSDKPYTGQPPVQTPASTTAPTTQDYSAQANPAIFQGELSRENYNAIRDTVLHRDEIAAGSYQPVRMGAFTRYGIIDEVTAAIGGYPVYEPIPQPDGSFTCTAKCPMSYKEALAHTQSFGWQKRVTVTRLSPWLGMWPIGLPMLLSTPVPVKYCLRMGSSPVPVCPTPTVFGSSVIGQTSLVS